MLLLAVFCGQRHDSLAKEYLFAIFYRFGLALDASEC